MVCAVAIAAVAALSGCRSRQASHVLFVRDGIVVTNCASRPQMLTPAPIRPGPEPSPLPGDAWFFPFPWKPGQLLSVQGTTVMTPQRPEAYAVARVDLERVRPGTVTGGGEPDACLAFDDAGRLLAVGSFGGYLRVYSVPEARLLWQRRFPEAMVKRVAFSPDGTRLYAGEQSPDGLVYGLAADSGRELWRLRLADDLLTSRPARPDDYFAIYQYPAAYGIRVDNGDMVYIGGFHSWRENAEPRHLSRLYAIDGATGRRKWVFPSDGPMPRNVNCFDVTRNGRFVALAAYQSEPPGKGDPYLQAGLYVLAGETGALLHRFELKPIAPFFQSVPIWHALSLGPDDTSPDAGPRGILGSMDGRLFRLADSQVTEVNLAAPVEVSGIPIHAGVGWSAASARHLFALTDGSLIAPSALGKGQSVQARHPGTDTLSCYDMTEGLEWQYQLVNTAQGVVASRDAEVVAVTTQQAFTVADPNDYGLTLLDVTGDQVGAGRVIFRYQTPGPIVASAISPDGRWLAVVEFPVVLADGLTTVGRYRVHLIH